MENTATSLNTEYYDLVLKQHAADETSCPSSHGNFVHLGHMELQVLQHSDGTASQGSVGFSGDNVRMRSQVVRLIIAMFN